MKSVFSLAIYLSLLLHGYSQTTNPTSKKNQIGSEHFTVAAEQISFRLFNNHIYLDVRIHNSKPLWFLLDTGASNIIDLDVAKDLNLTLYPFQKTDGVGDALEEVFITKNVLLHIHNTKFEFEKMPVVTLQTAEECANKIVVDTVGNIIVPENAVDNKNQYQTIDGVLGYAFFERFVIEINFKQQFLTLHDPQSYHYQGNGEIIPLDFTDNHIFINAAVKPTDSTIIHGRFMIDTGFMGALVLNTPFIGKNNLMPPSSEVTPFDVCGIGGSSKAQVGTIHGLVFQRININKPPTIFSQAEGGVLTSTEFDGIIGNAIFRHFKVIFDYSNKRMILE